MTKRMLVIPSVFVPYNETVTLLSFSRLKHLDLEMDVICFKGKEDAELLKTINNDPDIKKFSFEYAGNYDTAIAINHPLRLPLSLILMYRYIHKCLKKFEAGNYDYIYTSSVPGISNLCGKAIKKKHPEVKWIASFSDPIKKSPYKYAPDIKKRNIIYQIAYKVGAFVYYNDAYEKAAIDYANKFIFICEEQRDFTLSLYDNYEELKKRSKIIPLTYIPEWDMYKELTETKSVNNTPLIATHIGRLYGLRNATAFIEALNELNKEIPDLSKKIVFHQYSDIQPTDIALIKKYKLEELFIIHDRIDRKKVNEVIQNSDILLLFDTLMPDAPIQPYLPYKTIEYLLTHKPILAICDSNSPSYRILNDYGFKQTGSDIDTIKNNIKYLLTNKPVYNYSLEDFDYKKYSVLE